MHVFGFLRLLLAAAAVSVMGAVLLQPPVSRSSAGLLEEAASLTSSGGLRTKAPSETALRPAMPLQPDWPRARAALYVHLGPGEAYGVIGLIPANGPLDVVGRSKDGAWLAIRLGHGSPLRGWVAASGVGGVGDVDSLTVVPATTVSRR